MERQDPLSNAKEEPIGNPTTVEEIVSALARRGCSDLTLSINLGACGDFPCARGGFCDVYRGALHNGTRVAIRNLRLYDESEAGEDSDRQKVLKQTARELYHWSKLQHCNVLPLMGLAIFRGQMSMVSEWMENGNLMAYLKLNPGANRDKLCMDVCEGLCHIHKGGMAHGDLKAANVLVSPNGIAMISDFGSARLKNLSLRFSNSTQSGLSIRWAAPELLLEDSSQVSKEADVYAYGMTVLETVTGKVPYAEVNNDARVLYLIAVEKKVPPRPNFGICDGLWSLLNDCWTRTPPGRPEITSVRDSLQSLFWPPSDKGSIEDTTSQSISAMVRESRERPLIISLGGLNGTSASGSQPLASGPSPEPQLKPSNSERRSGTRPPSLLSEAYTVDSSGSTSRSLSEPKGCNLGSSTCQHGDKYHYPQPCRCRRAFTVYCSQCRVLCYTHC